MSLWDYGRDALDFIDETSDHIPVVGRAKNLVEVAIHRRTYQDLTANHAERIMVVLGAALAYTAGAVLGTFGTVGGKILTAIVGGSVSAVKEEIHKLDDTQALTLEAFLTASYPYL